MMMRWLSCLLLLACAGPLSAQPVSDQVTLRAATLLSALKTAKVDDSDFAPAFLTQVPGARVAAIARDLIDANGPAMGIAGIAPEGIDQAVIRIAYARSVVTVRIALEPDGAHRFIGLLVTGTVRRNDSYAAIIDEMKALPGRQSLLVARLQGDRIDPVAALDPDKPMAVGSAFKLFVLAALIEDIDQGKRHWEDVVPLGPPSLPSGVMQDWPARLPVTLATLATQMISISDNTATDTLMTILGRDRVDAMRAANDHSDAALPVLTTQEAFTLKMRDAAKERQRWTDGDLTVRRSVLAALDRGALQIDPTQLAGTPKFIDSVEWPASMKAIAQVLGRFRGQSPAYAQARAILSVTPSAAADDRARLAYVGYKGGSESGALALTWLLQTREGAWFVVAGAWNDPVSPIDPERFESLMHRLLVLIGSQTGSS